MSLRIWFALDAVIITAAIAVAGCHDRIAAVAHYRDLVCACTDQACVDGLAPDAARATAVLGDRELTALPAPLAGLARQIDECRARVAPARLARGLR